MADTYRNLADLVSIVTKEDSEAMTQYQYRLAADILIYQTEGEDREYYYRYGVLRGTLEGFTPEGGRRI